MNKIKIRVLIWILNKIRGLLSTNLTWKDATDNAIITLSANFSLLRKKKLVESASMTIR